MTTTDTPRTDAEITKEAKIVKLTKQNYHGLAKTKAAWYETMKKIRGIYEETETPRTDAETYVWQDGGENPFVHRDFARQLERELSEAKADVEQCKRDNGIIITAFALRNDKLKSEVERLRHLIESVIVSSDGLIHELIKSEYHKIK